MGEADQFVERFTLAVGGPIDQRGHVGLGGLDLRDRAGLRVESVTIRRRRGCWAILRLLGTNGFGW